MPGRPASRGRLGQGPLHLLGGQVEALGQELHELLVPLLEALPGVLLKLAERLSEVGTAHAERGGELSQRQARGVAVAPIVAPRPGAPQRPVDGLGLQAELGGERLGEPPRIAGAVAIVQPLERRLDRSALTPSSLASREAKRFSWLSRISSSPCSTRSTEMPRASARDWAAWAWDRRPCARGSHAGPRRARTPSRLARSQGRRSPARVRAPRRGSRCRWPDRPRRRPSRRPPGCRCRRPPRTAPPRRPVRLPLFSVEFAWARPWRANIGAT